LTKQNKNVAIKQQKIFEKEDWKVGTEDDIRVILFILV